MKKVLYFALFALTAFICGCNKDDDEPKQSNAFVRPYYFDWNIVWLKCDPSKSYDRLFYNEDSLIFESRYKVFEEERISITAFSTHNNIFAGKDPSNMTDDQVKDLARQWVSELKKESRGSYVEKLAVLGKEKDENDYGMLWGFKPKRYSANTGGLFDTSNTLSLYFGENYKIGYSFHYYSSYYYQDGGKTKGEYVRIKKEIPRNDGTILKDSQFLIEFDL